MGLKVWSYELTGSVSLFSDAAESSVNLVAALMALWMLSLAARPPDRDHSFGHSKAEYFSSGLEGTLVILAAVSIAIAALERLIHPQPLQQISVGMGLSFLAAAINGAVAYLLLRAGRRLRSITLRADAHHLLTDVWTSVGMIAGLFCVKVTGWTLLDPLMALLVALNIATVGVKLLRETANALMDGVLPEADQTLIWNTLARYQNQGIQFHALRTRVAGTRSFISFHVLVPGTWSVKQGHDLCEELELSLMRTLPGSHVMTHLEPLDDPASWADTMLDRPAPPLASLEDPPPGPPEKRSVPKE
ncbi:cation diffusion facilitator family transporter [Lyngbya confervoides BDU141951]|uniref:Cation diffusion facilitator family transporter n=2 Tax=Lyngbya TaxID=28073 RepID=A0ABD4SXW0_9CYAN|nr:cation diffusion facilitator family transporter [Lyngbya confervoides BDU141951]